MPNIITPGQEESDSRFRIAMRGLEAQFPNVFVLVATEDGNYIGCEGKGDWPRVLATWMVRDDQTRLTITKALINTLDFKLQELRQNPPSQEGIGG